MTEPRLRILYCTNGGLHGALVLARLCASPDVQVVGIMRSSRLIRASYGFWRGAMAHLRLSGWAYLIYLWCSTSLADILLRGRSVAGIARRKHIPVHMSANVNDAVAMKFATALSPDLLLSAFFNQRIREPLATLPGLAAVNIHPSLLPDFRGVDPVFFARLRKAEQLGVSVHRVASELDAGEIYRREVVPVLDGESVFKTTARLFDRGAQLLVEAIAEMRAGAIVTPQASGGEYDSWPTATQVMALRKQGTRLVSGHDLLDVMRTSDFK